jgi:hypothetical protein
MIGLRRGSSLAWLYLLVGSITAAICTPTVAQDACPAVFTPPSADERDSINLGWLKDQLKVYHQCAYDQDVEKVLGDARRYVEQRAVEAPNPAKPLAIVLDIDETVLSNWEEIVQNDFGYFEEGDCTMQKQTPCGGIAWVRLARGQAISRRLSCLMQPSSWTSRSFSSLAATMLTPTVPAQSPTFTMRDTPAGRS